MVMDTSGGLRLNIPSVSTKEGVVSIITSPGTKSLLTSHDNEDNVLALDGDEATLLCRGATLKGISTAERSALAITSVVSDVIVMDGITLGDVQAAGWKNTRHARTLTALFRARLSLFEWDDSSSTNKQTLILCVKTTAGEDATLENTLLHEVKSLFEATSAEVKGNVAFGDIYDVVVKTVASKEDGKEVRQTQRTLCIVLDSLAKECS
jgi:hypothetical protein